MLLPPPPRRRFTFVLTPLIDVIFLLLIFFMLSSQIAPYSLLPLGRMSEGGDGARPPAATDKGVAPMAVRIAHGSVNIGGEKLAISDLKEAAARFAEQGIRRYVLIPSAAADVQDMVSVLETLSALSAEVVLLNPRRAQP